MKVGSRGEPGVADVADDLPLGDASAFGDARGEARHVGVGGAVTVGVADADVVAITANVLSIIKENMLMNY